MPAQNDVGAGRRCAAPGLCGHCLDYRRVAALFGGNGVRIVLARVLVTVGEFRRSNGRENEARAESSRPALRANFCELRRLFQLK
jgi:hypothetical protein